MANKLAEYFPLIREREELMEIIRKKHELKTIFNGWKKEEQEEFLDFCTGVKGVKVLYDTFFKEVMNPEYAPERLERLLYVLLKKKVKIRQILPNDSTRISDENSLLITDIIVELEDGSIANVEIQKVGYHFPGERSACYSADMLLRQYKRVRTKYGKDFSYHQIKNVYLIILFENSPKEFKKFPQQYVHHAKQTFDSGLQLELLQEYVMISLDIFRKTMQNKSIETELEAWMTFLTCDDPERIVELVDNYPDFKFLYETIYRMCRNVEGVMGYFSEELRIMDRNMVKYMVEEQQKEIEERQKELEKMQHQLDEVGMELVERNKELTEKDKELAEKDLQIKKLLNKLEQYKK